MKRRGRAVQGVQRWLLALLCLLASGLYLTRQTEPDMTAGMNMSGMTASQMADMPGMDHDMTGTMDMPAPAQDAPDAASAPAGHAHHAPPVRAADLTTGAPNAPPVGEDHHHAGHCPFCFTAAFALQADGAVLVVGTSVRPVERPVTYLQPTLVPALHVDARAPPLS